MRIIRVILSLIIMLSLFTACLNRKEFSQEELQALVDRELERRLVNYEKIRKDRCKDQLIKEAQSIVDSILYQKARANIDSSLVPVPIPRPDKPEIREVKDTRPIQPLFDSLQRIELDTSGL